MSTILFYIPNQEVSQKINVDVETLMLLHEEISTVCQGISAATWTDTIINQVISYIWGGKEYDFEEPLFYIPVVIIFFFLIFKKRNFIKPDKLIVLGKAGTGVEYKDGHTIIDIINKDYSFETTFKGLTEIYGFEKANAIIENPSKLYKFYPFDKNLKALKLFTINMLMFYILFIIILITDPYVNLTTALFLKENIEYFSSSIPLICFNISLSIVFMIELLNYMFNINIKI